VGELDRDCDVVVMAFLRERLRPIAQPGPVRALRPLGTGGDEGNPLWLRYAEFVKLGFSPETSSIVAAAPVALADVTGLLLPEAAS